MDEGYFMTAILTVIIRLSLLGVSDVFPQAAVSMPQKFPVSRYERRKDLIERTWFCSIINAMMRIIPSTSISGVYQDERINKQ